MASDPGNVGLSKAIHDIATLMKQLRDPKTGCPWDTVQTFDTIAPYTIEEAYEVADAISRNDIPALKEELGDLLFQVVFHSRMAEETGAFNLTDVINGLVEKMTRRHPHVFGSNTGTSSLVDQPANWEAIKDAERNAKGEPTGTSVLDAVPVAAPALMRAEKLTKAAAKIGFDWPDVTTVFVKLDEERAELISAIEGQNEDEILDEMGDLLFVCANIARKLKINPEDALTRANAKFSRRFRHVELRAKEADPKPSLALLEESWLEAKALERQ